MFVIGFGAKGTKKRGIIRGYKGLQRVTRGYMGYKGLQRVTWVTRGYKGLHGLQGVCMFYEGFDSFECFN
jgi:hypothetical protein